MKKVFSMVIGGLQQKVFNLVLFVIILMMAVYTGVLIYETNYLQKLVSETNDRQEESIGEISSETMNSVVTESLKQTTSMQAYIGNSTFSELQGQVTLLSKYAEQLFADESAYPRLSYAEPDASNDGKISVQLMKEEGVDKISSDVADRLGLVANMSDLMRGLLDTANINSCFVALPDGVILIADDRAGAKFDEDGKLQTLAVRNRPWYIGAEEKGDLFFSDVELDAFTGDIGIVCSCPVYKDGKLAAIVGADLFLNTMSEQVGSYSTEGSFLCIVNQRGHVLFSPKTDGTFQVMDSSKAVDLRDSENEDLAQFVKDALTETTDVRQVTVDDKVYYMSGAYMDTVGWAALNIVDKEMTEQSTVQMQEQYAKISDDATNLFSEITGNIRRILIGLIILVFGLSVTGALFVAKRIVRPLNTMTKRVISLGGNNLQFFMEDTYKTGDEIEELAKSFERLSSKTLQYVDEVARVTAEKERIGAELNVATQIQADMLPTIFPPFPDRDEFELFATMEPAKEVGGDFYDYFMIDDDHIALVMADVSGKGVPAALFMVIAKTLIKNRAQMGGTPSEILAFVNDQLCEGNKADLFVTVWLGIIEISTGKGLASNAGHEHPAIKRAGGEYELVIYKHSPAVATMEGMSFREHEFDLHPGDSLYVYTDGVAEATDAGDELYGTDRMLAALNKAPDADPMQTLKAVREDIDDFVAEAPQFDDITMLSFHYIGPDK